jgi:hypothetical protein
MAAAVVIVDHALPKIVFLFLEEKNSKQEQNSRE